MVCGSWKRSSPTLAGNINKTERIEIVSGDTHGGFANGIPKNLDTFPDAAPVKVPASRTTVGAARGAATTARMLTRAKIQGSMWASGQETFPVLRAFICCLTEAENFEL
jgi:hypothetical protein